MTPHVTVVPANEASWEDIEAVFGTRGQAACCQCQRFKLRPRESFGSFPVEERAFRLRTQTDAGHPESDSTSGLVGYVAHPRLGTRSFDPPLLHDIALMWTAESERDVIHELGSSFAW
jgi:hypothetical protein